MWEGRECRMNITRYLNKEHGCSRWREDNIKVYTIIIFNDLNCSINEHSVWLFERHILSPQPNTIILTNVMVVTSEHDTEPACFVRLYVIFKLLQWLIYRKVHRNPWNYWKFNTDAVACGFNCGHSLEGHSQWPLACWDCGFETRCGHACIFLVTVVRSRPGNSYRMWCVWVW